MPRLPYPVRRYLLNVGNMCLFFLSASFESDYVLVYRWCMSRTNIDIDEKACAAVMRRYHFSTKREAVNFALQALATEPFSLDEARKLRGSGWEGHLEEMRANRSS